MSSSATVTAPAAPRSAGPGAEAQPVTLRRVVRSEWIKFWTLRSTWAVLGAAVAGMLVLALVVAWLVRPAGIATFGGLALFQFLAIVSSMLPLIKEIRQT